jgi:asparagine synthase (glutamine-hydrolysing)
MLGALEHRGPDGTGFVADEFAALGATRLAIRGLSDGHQPIVDLESGVMAACNGEIDNHGELRAWLKSRGREVRGATDVAILPPLYLEMGGDFVERLVGAFAIALWDPRVSRLLLARDRAGERPLFYAERDGQVTFATEIAALALDPERRPRPDTAALTGYLRFGHFVAPASPFQGIRKVGPAETVIFDGRETRPRRYWRWPIVEAVKRPPSENSFDEVFRQAVGRQRDAEVKCGVFLSGGLDSSLVAAVAVAACPHEPLPAYTIRFEESSYDEGDQAARVASLLGLELSEVWVGPEQLSREIDDLIRLAGEPLGDPAWVPSTLLARVAARDVKLALVGEGGDELFGGYPTYLGANVAHVYGRLPRGARKLLAAVIRRLPSSDRKVPLSFLLRRFVEGAEMEGVVRHRLWTSQISPTLLARLGVPSLGEDPVLPERTMLLDFVQRMDLETSLAEGLLTKADRSSMRWPLELRAPFLDQYVMEYASTLPIAERVHGLRTKVFLKRYATRYLPRSVVHRRKRGLSVPLAAWLRGPLYDWTRETLAERGLEEIGVRTAACLELLEEHRRMTADHGRLLWDLLVLSRWLTWVNRTSSLGTKTPAGQLVRQG